MAVDERRIAVLGTGRIGEALIAGLLSSGWRTKDEIVASSRRAERATVLKIQTPPSPLTWYSKLPTPM